MTPDTAIRLFATGAVISLMVLAIYLISVLAAGPGAVAFELFIVCCAGIAIVRINSTQI